MRNKLVKASIWAKSQFAENSIPDRKTIKKWIERGKIRGLVDQDGSLWVFEHQIFGVNDAIGEKLNKLLDAS